MLVTNARIHTLGRALRGRFGRRLRRIMLDLGLSCPNRDGNKGYGGCIYCDIAGSGTGAAPRLDLRQQFETELARVRKSQPTGPCGIAYLQSYSNTYPDLEPLERALAELGRWAPEHAPVLAIGTRPDCFSEAAAALIARARERFQEVWIEFGLETADDRVQKIIGRHDTLENFHRACDHAHEHGLRVIAHTIAGLPGEREDGLLRQVEAVKTARVHGIKFHQLMVLRKTKLEHLWREGRVQLLEVEQYVQLVSDALEQLPPGIEVHRLAAQSPPEEYLAPLGWPSKAKVHGMIEQELVRRNSHQGRHCAI